jgi:hypothetical protein
VNIDQHKMPTSVRQPRFYQLAIKPRPGSMRNRLTASRGVSDAISFTRNQTTEGGHRGKRDNEKDNDCDLAESQRSAREDLQSSKHCNLRQETEFRGYKNNLQYRRIAFLG